MKIWDGMDPHRTLFETSLVRLAILIPSILAIGASTLVFLDPATRDQIGLSNLDGIQAIYRSLTIPFLILSLAIPFTALVAGHHRSLQNRHQIQVQDQQNIFSNYVKHRELFIDFCSQSNPLPQVAKPSHEIYAIVFPNAEEGVLEPGKEILPGLQVEIERIYSDLISLLDDSVNRGNFMLSSKDYQEQVANLDRIYQRFSDSKVKHYSHEFRENGLIIVSSCTKAMGYLLDGLYSCCNFLRSYCKNREDFTLSAWQKEIQSRIEKLDTRFYTLKQVREAIDRHIESTVETGYRTVVSPLPQSLKDIHKNQKLYLLDTLELKSFLDNVLIKHLTDKHFSILSEHLPHEWKDALDYKDEDGIV